MTFTAFQCPRSGQPLRVADERLVAAVNRQITDQRAVTVEGQPVDELIDGGWYCPQSRAFYPVRLTVVHLLADQAVDLRSLDLSGFDQGDTRR